MTRQTAPRLASGRIDFDAWARADYASYLLDCDLQNIKRFVQSNCRYKTSYYEQIKWAAYGSGRRIAGESHRWPKDLVGLAAILDRHGVSYKPGRVATRVLAEARA